MMFDYRKIKNPTIFKENVLPAHSDHEYYSSEEMLMKGRNEYRQSLNGLWKFHYARNFTQRIDGFEKPETDCHAWEDIRVPAHIQMEGYDIPAYVNIQYPWDGHEQIEAGEIPTGFNPIASYVKYFTLPSDMKDKPVYISFQGVESAMILWLNGHYVGYSEDTFTPSEFELTPYLCQGENKLAVQVIKWSSSSWTEDQDFFRFSGIFRDVYLFTVPQVHVWDLSARTTLNETYTEGSLQLSMKCVGSGTVEAQIRPWTYRNSLLRKNEDAQYYFAAADGIPGTVYAAGRTELAGQDGTLEEKVLCIPIEQPQLWSAEQPVLYEAFLIVKDIQGNVTEVISQQVGFRRFEIKDGLMCLNGRRIVFKGVNRHEFSSVSGRVPAEDELLQDLLTMKRNNINAIRTSHYPNASPLYRLCDEIGLYMIAENNMESHGAWEPYQRGMIEIDSIVPGDNPDWQEMMLDRVNSCYQRDKNHPAILIWSCGNESFGGINVLAMSDRFRELDPDRPVHYEGIFNDRRYNDTSDMESQMYPSVESIKAFLREHRDKPFICCEYSHAMGNSCGGMHKYTDLTDEEPLYQGGFIWDYIDQSIYKKDRYGNEFQAYGGDFGERPSDFNFSGNGIVYGGDRTPSPKLQEVKHNYSNIAVRFEAGQIMVHNKNLFTATSVYDCILSLMVDGKTAAIYHLDTDVPPLGEAAYELPEISDLYEGELIWHVSFVLKKDTAWAKAGHEVSHSWNVLRAKQKAFWETDAVSERVPADPKGCDPETKMPEGRPTVIYGKNNFGVRGDGFEALFSYSFGGLVSYRYGGKELLAAIPKPNFWRAPTDNDDGNQMAARYAQWKIASMYLTHKDIQTNVWAEPLVEEGEHCVKITYTYQLPTTPEGQCHTAYCVYADGTVSVSLTYDPVKELGDMPEYGMLFKLDADYEFLTWYGLGPEETYADRCRGGRPGIYHNRVSDNMARYLVPQECGNKTGVRWAKVCDRKGRGLLFMGDNMSFSALPYTPHEIENARHAYELPQVHYTVVRAALAQMGIAGDDSWGSRTHKEYLIDCDKPLSFTFAFRGL